MSLIGAGAQACVYPEDDNVRKTFGSMQQCVSEWVMSSPLNHPNIVKPDKIDLESKSIIMSSYDSSLADRLRSNDMSIDEKLLVVRDVMNGLSHMHKNHICHSDINPMNILVKIDKSTNRVCLAVICDLGLASLATKDKRAMTNAVYRDPMSIPGFAHDIYSLGVTIIELFSSSKEWARRVIAYVTRKTSSRDIGSMVMKFISSVPLQFKGMVMSMLSNNPQDRKSIREYIADMGWVADDGEFMFSDLMTNRNTDKLVEEMKPYLKGVPRGMCGCIGVQLYLEMKPNSNRTKLGMACAYILNSTFNGKKIPNTDVENDKELVYYITDLVTFNRFLLAITTPSDMIKCAESS